MSEFNIHGSKIEQLSDTGNNYQLGKQLRLREGKHRSQRRTQNRVIVDRPKESLFALAWAKLKSLWKLVRGK